MGLAKQVDIDDALFCVNTERYPLNCPDSVRYQRAVTEIKAQLDTVGCARVPAFINDRYKDALEAEVAAIADLAHFSNGTITPYFNKDDETLPKSHPRRRFADFSNGFVAMDRFPIDGICLNLYHSADFQRFISDCLGEQTLYTFDDPLAGVVANIMPEGSSLPWHFDTNEFIVSLLTKKPLARGDFEYCPDIRRPGDECYDTVQSVLDGDTKLVQRLNLDLGDLQIFRGRFSMHRVIEAEGERHTAIFGYAKEPGFIGKVERTMQVHNRVTQAHIDAENIVRNDGLED